MSSENLAAGIALIEGELEGWRASYRGFDRCWLARSPRYAEDGITVEARTPEELVARARRLVLPGVEDEDVP